MSEPDFLTIEEVLEIHALQLARFGGGEGVRDLGLLESAIAQPMQSFGGEYVHGDLFLMAAAYLFHLVSNHPFVDGNKRTGYLAVVVFLDHNGVEILHGVDELYALTIQVAQGMLDKTGIAARIREIAEAPDKLVHH